MKQRQFWLLMLMIVCAPRMDDIGAAILAAIYLVLSLAYAVREG